MVISTASLLVVVFVLGLLVGSFLNVVIARVPHGQSIVRPGSRCPRCGHVLELVRERAAPVVGGAPCALPELPGADLHPLPGGGAADRTALPRRRVGLRPGLAPAPGPAPRRVPGAARPHRPRALDRPGGGHGARDGGRPRQRGAARMGPLQGRAIGAAAGFLVFWALERVSLLLVVKVIRPPLRALRAVRRPMSRSEPPEREPDPDRGARRGRQVAAAPRGELPRLAAALRRLPAQRPPGGGGGKRAARGARAGRHRCAATRLPGHRGRVDPGGRRPCPSARGSRSPPWSWGWPGRGWPRPSPRRWSRSSPASPGFSREGARRGHRLSARGAGHRHHLAVVPAGGAPSGGGAAGRRARREPVPARPGDGAAVPADLPRARPAHPGAGGVRGSLLHRGPPARRRGARDAGPRAAGLVSGGGGRRSAPEPVPGQPPAHGSGARGRARAHPAPARGPGRGQRSAHPDPGRAGRQRAAGHGGPARGRRGPRDRQPALGRPGLAERGADQERRRPGAHRLPPGDGGRGPPHRRDRPQPPRPRTSQAEPGRPGARRRSW